MITSIAGPALGVGSVLFPEFAPILAPMGMAAEAANQVVGRRRANRKAKKKQKKLDKASKKSSGRVNMAGQRPSGQ